MGEVLRSLCDFSEFKAILVLQPDVIEVSKRENTCWEKPSVSVVRIYCDTSVRGNGVVGIGFVLRDNTSKVLDRVQENLDVETVEMVL